MLSQHTPTAPIEQEEWRPVPDYEGLYEVSNLGRLRSSRAGRGTHPGRLKQSWPDDNGYPRVGLFKGGKARHIALHIVVALAFLGPRPDGYEVNHKDTNRLNPAASNLEYVTSSENKIHAVQQGVWGMSKINADIVRAIRASSEHEVVLAARFNVSRQCIWSVRAGRSWRHVQ